MWHQFSGDLSGTRASIYRLAGGSVVSVEGTFRLLRKSVVPLLFSSVVLGCNSAPGALEASGDDTLITLVPGSETRVGSVVVNLIAIDEDSRCPVDVVCIWSGNVKLRVGVRTTDVITPLTLNTALTPLFGNAEGFRITIHRVLPELRSIGPRPVAEYQVTLRVEKL
jgi:hypothetical protein